MPQKVYNNVVDHRILDNGRTTEDVTSITPPSLKYTTSNVAAAGMVMDVEMPNPAHLESMEFAVAHNNGTNCKYLSTPGKHQLEARVVRERYNVARGEMEYESVKFRVTGMHKGTDNGTIEKGNPYGKTDKYSVLRYEEEIAGTVVTLIDAMAGIVRVNGKDYTSPIENLLK